MNKDEVPWWKTAVVYQIYPRSFQDSNGDGVGDLNGITSRLDDLVALGIDALWLSPIQTSPMADFGYDIADYRGIDPLFGTMDDFDRLLAESHRRGLKVLLDIVVNHSSDQHPWFQESRSSLSNPKRDWYHWHEGPRPPNNWQSVFGGPAWHRDEVTGSWFLHSFLRQQPDLNWRNPDLRRAFFDDFEFWLKKGVDGFRLDVFNLWLKDPGLRSNPLRLVGGRHFRPYDWQKHLHDGFQPDLHPLLHSLRGLLDRFGATAIGETYAADGWDPALAASYLGQGDELPLVFEFSGLDDPWSARATAATMARWMELAKEPNWPALVYSNHDVVRAKTRLARGLRAEEADQRAKVMAALLLLWKGTPFLYYGEEIGLPQVKIPRTKLRDPVGRKYWPFHPGRDGARTPMAWNAGPEGGFSTAPPWLPLHPDHARRNVEVQRSNPQSLWNWYSSLLALRKQIPAFQVGSWEPVELGTPDALGFVRRWQGKAYLVAASFSKRPTAILIPGTGRWIWGSRNREALEAGLHVLDGYEVFVAEVQT